QERRPAFHRGSRNSVGWAIFLPLSGSPTVFLCSPGSELLLLPVAAGPLVGPSGIAEPRCAGADPQSRSRPAGLGCPHHATGCLGAWWPVYLSASRVLSSSARNPGAGAGGDGRLWRG